MNVYLTRGGQQFGPYTREWLESFVADGSVSPDDLAHVEGTEGWVPLRNLLEEWNPPAAPVPPPAPAVFEAPSPEPEPEAAPVAPEPVMPKAPPKPIPWRLILTRAGVAALALLILAGMVAMAHKPDHVRFARNGNSLLRPDPGYVFADLSDSLNWNVRWAPGTPSATEAHVLAASTEGTWVPAPGYERSGASGSVVWVEGKREAEYPHVKAGSTADVWVADPGYIVTGSATRPTAAWSSGIRYPHLVSSEREGYWKVDPGYRLAPGTDEEEPRAVWTPGSRHNEYPHIYAANEQDKWYADDGYAWLSSDSLATFNIARTRYVWTAVEQIDAATRGLSDCSWAAAYPVVTDARDRYAALPTDELPPGLAENITAMHAQLSSGATTLAGCLVADNAGDAADVGAGILCIGTFFSNDNETWEDCMKKSETARKIVHGAGKLGTLACQQPLHDFRTNIDQLIADRQQLQAGFRSSYGLALPQPSQILTCQ